ncbi:hypothetical protein RHS01_08399 [Rhizoctonia solani]|uniref:Uncharacterized protein n=1 Tax=Rhizoctonia solani TaxID=456999 RepID=A0A8H7I909_9AGAM|nr:hypothetical protein RHS01_08399 [Rhizoctonia solani]
MPHPLSKVDPIGSTSWVSFWPKPSKGLPAFAQPTPVQAVPQSHLPLYLRVSNPQLGQPPLHLRLQLLPIPLWSRLTTPMLHRQNREQSKAVADLDVSLDPPQLADVPHQSRGSILPLDEHEGHRWGLGPPSP